MGLTAKSYICEKPEADKLKGVVNVKKLFSITDGTIV